MNVTDLRFKRETVSDRRRDHLQTDSHVIKKWVKKVWDKIVVHQSCKKRKEWAGSLGERSAHGYVLQHALITEIRATESQERLSSLPENRKGHKTAKESSNRQQGALCNGWHWNKDLNNFHLLPWALNLLPSPTPTCNTTLPPASSKCTDCTEKNLSRQFCFLKFVRSFQCKLTIKLSKDSKTVLPKVTRQNMIEEFNTEMKRTS